MPPAATFAAGMIVSGATRNILAHECKVLWDYRELPVRKGLLAGDALNRHVALDVAAPTDELNGI